MDVRTFIQLGLMVALKPAQIALELSHSASTITRELKRNGWIRPVKLRGGGRPAHSGCYQSVAAQNRAQSLMVKPKTDRRLRVGNVLWGKVTDYLKLGYSPEQIAGTLKLIHPQDPTLQVSHERIYTAIYAMPRGELRTEVVGWLRQGHAKHRLRTSGEDRRGQIPDMVNIRDRPPEVDERLVPGQWEGDLIKGAFNRSSIGTLVERATLFTVLAKMPTASAESAVDGFAHVLNRLEAQKSLSMTYDQGKEMSDHKRLSLETGVTVYFADPHSPWQRGINENTNGLLQQYFPKGMDLNVFTQEYLDSVAWQVNIRPRKSMGWKCPAEMFTPESFDFKQHHASLFALAH